MNCDETRPGAALDRLDRLRQYVAVALDDELADRQAVLERAGTELGIICAGLPADSVVLTAAQDTTLRAAIAEAVTAIRVHTRACMFRPGAVVLSSAEAGTAWQALADAAAWRAERVGEGGSDCVDCARARTRARAERAPDPDHARCPEHSRDEAIAADYAALRTRLGGDHR